MIKLVTLLFIILISGGVYAQSETNYAINNLKSELNYNKSMEVQSSTPVTETLKSKSPGINSAARRSSFNSSSYKKLDSVQNLEKKEANAKSMVPARKTSTGGRPVNLNIPVIPLPALTRPNRMFIPNRRVFLPIGKL